MVLIGLAALLLVFVLVAFRRRPSALNASAYPYQPFPNLFTSAERSFITVLEQRLGRGYRIMGKVRIADLVSVQPLEGRKARREAFDRIRNQSFDFVLCDENDLIPVAVMELEGKSYGDDERRQRDELLEGICKATGLALFHIPARHAYTRSDVERLVVNRLFARPKQVVSHSDIAELPLNSTRREDQDLKEKPLCPKCSSTMNLRRIKRGDRAGQYVWSCVKFPQCRGARPVVAARVSRQKGARATPVTGAS